MRLKQTLAEKLVKVQAARHPLRLVGLDAGLGDLQQALLDLGEIREHRVELVLGDLHDLHGVQRRAGGGARRTVDQADLAEVIATAQIGADHFAAGQRVGNFHHALADEIKGVGDVALFADDLILAKGDQFDFLLEVIKEQSVERGEETDAAEMVVQRALAIFLVHLRLERRALEGRHLDLGAALGGGIDLARAHEHVEDDAQHFHHHAVLAGAHRGRARLEGAAGHLAEQLAHLELRDGAGDGQIDRGVDGNEGAGVIVALLGEVGDQEAFHPRHETAERGLGFDVGDFVGDENIDLARDDVEGRRAERTLLADDLALLETPQHRRAVGPLELGGGVLSGPADIREAFPCPAAHRLEAFR